MMRPHRTLCRRALAAAAVLGLAACCAWAQEQRFRERQVFDPNAGTWVDEDRPPEAGPLDELDEIRALLAENEWGAARDRVKKWMKANPDHERYQEAEFLLGETYYLGRDFWKAVEHYQSVAENSSGDLFQLANGRCIDVARAFLSGQKRILWVVLRIPAYAEAIEILDRVWQRAPGSRMGEIALRLKGDYYFGNGDMELAQDEYANLVKQYPSGRWVQLGMLRTAESAEAAFPGIRFDDQSLIEAQERYRQFQTTFPTYAERENIDARLKGIRQQRADKDLDIAGWYERTRRTDAAEYYYRLILKDWPDTLAAAEARSRLRALGATMEPAAGEAGQAEDGQ